MSPHHTNPVLVALWSIPTVLTLSLPPLSSAIVTSDANGTHAVAPTEEAYGLNLDGVAKLGLAELDGSGNVVRDPFPVCTGSLISDRYLITAAHCFDAANENGEPESDGQIDEIFRLATYAAFFELPGSQTAVQMNLDAVQFAPGWPEQPVDIAIVELQGPAPITAPRYPLYSASDEVGKTVVVAGYGLSGHGSVGIDLSIIATDQAKRVGLNRYEKVTQGDVGDVTVRDATEFLSYDFDSGLAANNTFDLNGIPSDLGFGDDEVLSVVGDSGGPSFVNGAIAGVFSRFLSYPDGDATPELDGSWARSLGMYVSLRIGNSSKTPLPAVPASSSRSPAVQRSLRSRFFR